MADQMGRGTLKILERKLRAYVVIGDDGQAITCG